MSMSYFKLQLCVASCKHVIQDKNPETPVHHVCLFCLFVCASLIVMSKLIRGVFIKLEQIVCYLDRIYLHSSHYR
jgi:hypothetical protein